MAEANFLRGSDEIIKTVFLFPNFPTLKLAEETRENQPYLVFKTPAEMPILTKLVTTPDIRNGDDSAINLYECKEHRAEERINRNAKASVA